MEKDHFLLADKIQEIKSEFLLKNGWLKIYQSSVNEDEENDSTGVYCCLIHNQYVNDFKQDYHWPIQIGSEGKPAVFGDNTYKTYSDDQLEPFLFSRFFKLPDKSERYIDISEEFILYFNLYETGQDKQNRKFYYVDDYGELDEAIIVDPNQIRVKIKYLKEYITIRDMHFVICYDYMRLMNIIPQDWQIQYSDTLVSEENYIYSHLIRDVMDQTQSWIMGKTFIEPNSLKKTRFDIDSAHYEKFITGHDKSGELILNSCGDAEGHHFTITFFRKEVLDKYYNNPDVYNIDSFSLSSKFFHLKMDNNVRDYVPVFLRDLRMLPEKEQLHWKQYNIPPQDGMGMSGTYYRTMIEGQWAENPETVDLFFKKKYKDFNKKWKAKFGYYLYKPLSTKDEYLFKSLHLITGNNIKSFCEQTLTLVKLTIDRINEKEIAKDLQVDANTRGIAKFEKFIEGHDLSIPDMFVFLRHLQNLRSGLIAHSFSETNKDCKKAMDYFEINKNSYVEILQGIFSKSINTLNTLEKYFEL